MTVQNEANDRTTLKMRPIPIQGSGMIFRSDDAKELDYVFISGDAAKVMKTMLEPCKDMTYTDTTVKILSAVTPENEEQIGQLATEILA